MIRCVDFLDLFLSEFTSFQSDSPFVSHQLTDALKVPVPMRNRAGNFSFSALVCYSPCGGAFRCREMLTFATVDGLAWFAGLAIVLFVGCE